MPTLPLWLLSRPLYAATLTVGPAQAYTTIGEAISAAAAGDRIEVEAGTYDEAAAMTVAIDLEIVSLSGSAATIWNGPQAGIALRINGGATVTLEGFDLNSRGALPALLVDQATAEVSDLLVTGSSAAAAGGAVVAIDSTVTIEDSVFDGNSAGEGGGHLYAEGSTLTVRNTDLVGGDAALGGAIHAVNSDVVLESVTIDGNVAGEQGGGVAADGGTLSLDGCTVSSNQAGGAWGEGDGGGLSILGNAVLTVVATTFSTNTSDSTGGAIRIDDDADATLDLTTFDANDSAYGGAIYLGTSGQVDILGSSFLGNLATAGNGGAIRTRPSGDLSLVLIGTRFEGNSATSFGGAIATTTDSGYSGGSITMDFCTFIGNSADTGGALNLANLDSVEATHLTFCSNIADFDGGGARVNLSGGSGSYWAYNVFTENAAAGAGGGLHFEASAPATVVNNTFLGNRSIGGGGGGVGVVDTAVTFVNNLVAFTAGGDGFAGTGVGPFASVVTYSAFFDNVNTDLPFGLAAEPTLVFDDPMLEAWSEDGDCSNDLPWPVEASPLVDAGDPALLDPDGSPSDIGAYGGPDADWDVFVDDDQDGFNASIDCDDTDAAVNPDATETCNGVDDDCNGLVDDDATGGTVYYGDGDGDGFGATLDSLTACAPPAGYATVDGDCDDGNGAVNPGATEVCNAIDDNCDGGVDEGVVPGWYPDTDGDGFGDPDGDVVEQCDPPTGLVDDDTDCDDTDPEVNPGAEDPKGDGFDANCDGSDGVLAEDIDEDLKVLSGCGCSGTGGSASPLAALLALGIVLRRGRGQRRD